MTETNPGVPSFSFAADRLLAAHDGDVALLYLYIQRYPVYDAEEAASTLCRTLREIRSAEEKLCRMGLWPGAETAPAAAAPPQPEERLPEYTTADVMQRIREDENFPIILAECESVFQRKLSTPDTKILFGIYDHLGLPVEVLLELLHFCGENRKGRLSLHQVEKEAYVWVNREILTLEQAEEYIRHYRQRSEELERLRSALGIRDRALSPTEKKCMNGWLDMGFGEDAILIAYDRTVTKTGAYKLRYMDTILQSWHAKNLHTPQEIEAGDGRRGGAEAGDVSRKQLEQLDELRKRLR